MHLRVRASESVVMIRFSGPTTKRRFAPDLFLVCIKRVMTGSIIRHRKFDALAADRDLFVLASLFNITFGPYGNGTIGVHIRQISDPSVITAIEGMAVEAEYYLCTHKQKKNNMKAARTPVLNPHHITHKTYFEIQQLW